MSIYACLVSSSMRATLFLGKPLRQPGGVVSGFWRGDGFGADFAQALWRLTDEAGDLVMASEGMNDYELSADLPDIGGLREDGDLPYEEFLASRPAVRARYFDVRLRSDAGPRRGAPAPVVERHLLTDPPGRVERFAGGRWVTAGPHERALVAAGISEADAVMEVLLALHDAHPEVVRHHARTSSGRSRFEPGRFRYWATDTGRAVLSGLLRYDSSVTGPGAGAVLCADSRWRRSERPERNVWLGSDYGEPVSPGQAREIAVALGHPADVVDAEAVPRTT